MSCPEVKMKFTVTSAATLLLIVLAWTTPVEGFFRNRMIGELGLGRVDPIVSPGSPSQHLHHLHGAQGKL